MTLLIVFSILAILVLQLIEGNWKAAMMITFLLGFLQDPLRKLTPGQPAWMVGLVLVGFSLTAFTIYAERRGHLNIRSIVWTMPALEGWLPIYFSLIAFQALNSFYRFSSPSMTIAGIIFYTAPVVGLWVGFQIGCNQWLLKRLLVLYIALSSITAVTVLMSYQGFEHPILQEVGEGIEIIFRWGFHAKGASGLWRTSEIAGWQLTAAACFSITMAFSMAKIESQIGLLMLAAVFTFLTILTGRRKAIAMVVAYCAIYLILFSRRSDQASKEKVITNILGVTGLSYVVFSLFLVDNMGDNFGEYVKRATSTTQDIGSRFSGQGVRAMLRAIEVSNGIGLGAGVGSNTGGLSFGAARSSISSANFVAEGGGGRLILELGIPGIIIILVMASMVTILIIRNFKMLRFLPQSTTNLYLGLLCFALANLPFFYSAAQLYSDPFILVLMSISFGSFFAIPTLLSQQQAHQRQQLHLQSPQGAEAPTAFPGNS